MLCLLLLPMLLALPARAVVEVEPLSTPQLQARYKHMIAELRCPKCQNQNLADSNSPIAADLRREVRHLLEQGHSDPEITEFLVSRYGDFVLYRPPVQRNTLTLWLAPAVLLAIGLVVTVAVIRRQRRSAAPAAAAPLAEGDDPTGDSTRLSSEDEARLARLFAQTMAPADASASETRDSGEGEAR